MNSEEKNRLRNEDLQRLRGFRLLDDDFMSKVFEDIECTELLLRIILEKDDLKVESVNSQYSLKNLQGRSARLDIFAKDSKGKTYNVEVQRSDKGAVAKRARYNSSLIDANITEPGEEYEALPENYVIFITENDVIGDGLPIYHVERVITETGKLFGDDSHIIYVNSLVKDESALGQLMHDFWCTDADDMHYRLLADRVRYFKEEQEGVESMCRAMEEMRDKAAAEAAAAATVKNTLELVRNLMQSMKMTAEQAMNALMIPEEKQSQYSKML